MSRVQVVLAVVVAILLVALFYVLLLRPAQDRRAELEQQIAAEQGQQVTIQADIGRLRAVRERAPEVEAELASAEAIVPRDASLPSALRQLQLAADESGVVLSSVTTSRPAALSGGAPDGLSRIDVNVRLIGGYFQTVDFLRRVEDPRITPRGIEWGSANLTIQDEYPTLGVTLTGALYAVVEAPPPPPSAPVEEDDEDADDVGDPASGEDAA